LATTFFVNTTATFESDTHGTVSVSGRYVAAERDCGVPAHFEIESATAHGIEVDLTDAEREQAIDALLDAREAAAASYYGVAE